MLMDRFFKIITQHRDKFELAFDAVETNKKASHISLKQFVEAVNQVFDENQPVLSQEEHMRVLAGGRRKINSNEVGFFKF